MMVSNDETARIELLLREHFARTDKQLSDMRAENAEFRAQMMKDNAEFRAEMVRLHNDFAEKQTVKFDTFAEKTNAKIDGLTAAVVELQRDVEGLKHDVQGLYHWDYWLLSIILVVFAMPQIVAGIKSLFGALAEGISQIVGAFRKDSK